MSVTKEELDRYIAEYNRGHELISDAEYDRLLEEYLREHGNDKRPFTRNKQSSSVNDIVGTLDKVYGVKIPMRENQMVYADWEYRRLANDKKLICIQPKLDGCSIAYDVKLQKFSTRGDYDNGESVDVTDLFKDRIDMLTKYLDAHRKYNADSIKFEAILPRKIYDEMFSEMYKRPRDVVAATITSRNLEYAKYITLFPLRIYQDGKQYIPAGSFIMDQCEIAWCDDFEKIQSFIDYLLEHNALTSDQNFTYECDGVVVSVASELTAMIGVNDEAEVKTSPYINPSSIVDVIDFVTDPTKEVAIKILNNVEITKLRNIEWQFGRSGRITPVAIVDPVKFGNITVTNIGLSTFERVSNMKLRFGDTVKVVYNIVPYLLESMHDGELPIPIPTTCPICHHKMDMHSMKQVRCVNPQCKGRKLGAIIRYADKMKMFGVSSGILTKLFELGLIDDIPDLYTLTKEQLSGIDGFGNKSADNIIQSIKSASTNVPIHRWLGALPCKDVSDKTWKVLLGHVYGFHNPLSAQAIRDLCKEESPTHFLETIQWYTPGIGNITRSNINEGILTNWNVINRIIPYITFEIPPETKGVICMSGTRDKNTIAYLQNHGYEVTDSFSRKCYALVIPDYEFSSKKVDQARLNSIPIYTVDEILKGVLDH